MLSILERAALVFATVSLGACSSASQVPVGTNTSRISADDGGSSGDDSACANLPVETIACATGRTVTTCDTSTSQPKWKISCPDESVSDAGPCGDEPINTIGCPSSEPTITCDTSGATPHWNITCPSETDASGDVHGDAATTACDGLPVEAIGCATGVETYTCVADKGAPHWSVGCQ
jgi:hypothetical protein